MENSQSQIASVDGHPPSTELLSALANVEPGESARPPNEIATLTEPSEDPVAVTGDLTLSNFLRLSLKNHPVIITIQLLLSPLCLILLPLWIAISELFGFYIVIRYLLLIRKGSNLELRHSAVSSQADLDGAISSFYEALLLFPEEEQRSRTLKSHALYRIGNCLLQRYYAWKIREDLEEAVGFYQAALATNPPDNIDNRSTTLSGLGVALFVRYKESGDTKELEEAVRHLEEVLSLQPIGHPTRPTTMFNLASCLDAQYELQGVSRELEIAVEYSKAALQDPPEHLERTSLLTQVGQCLKNRYDRWHETSDIEDAVLHCREALVLAPTGHPDRVAIMSGLSVCLAARYDRLGNIGDNEEAIGYGQEVLRLTPITDPSRSTALANLASSLADRSLQTNQENGLEEAILLFREALLIGAPNPNMLVNMAHSLVFLWGQKGGAGVLEEAIGNVRQALLLLPSTHTNRYNVLCCLTECLITRYIQEHNTTDLVEVNELIETLAQKPTEHPAVLRVLLQMSILYGAFGGEMEWKADEIGNLDQAIGLFRGALLLLPPGQPLRPFSMLGFAACLGCQFRASRDIRYLNEAIEVCQDAMLLHPLGVIRMFVRLSLATYLHLRYHCLDDLQDLDIAMAYLEEPLWDEAPHHPLQATRMATLADLYLSKYDLDDQSDFLDTAIDLFQKAVDHPSASVFTRLHISFRWIDMVDDSRNLAYPKCLELADRYIMNTPSITSRHQMLKSTPAFLAYDAAAHSISDGEYEKAVELLEQGKTVIWSQLTRYRSSIEGIMQVNEELATRFLELGQRLETVAVPLALSSAGKAQISAEEEALKYRRLSEQWEETLEEIRHIDGFETFLRPVPFSVLKQAAKNGPVIIVNISKIRSDIIIVQDVEEPRLIRLRKLRIDDIVDLASELTAQVTIMRRRGKMQRKKVIYVLRRLWEIIVGPTVKVLQEMKIANGSRIWWCPTSLLSSLPLHAAGIYKTTRPNHLDLYISSNTPQNLPDLYISSYTPTLAALLRASDQQHACTHMTPPTLLLVAQPSTPGQRTIEGVYEELKRIQQIVPSVELLLGNAATVEAVQDRLPAHRWIHFACHGSSDLFRPFESRFHLHNGSLNLLEIIQKPLPDAEFAFLSACHSAAGDRDSPDEAIHLAAGLQFSGFRSVIGTMYGMMDADGPFVAETVYEHMFRPPSETEESRSGQIVDFRDAAKALNVATRALRDTGVPLERWINFVHIGA